MFENMQVFTFMLRIEGTIDRDGRDSLIPKGGCITLKQLL